MRRTVITLFAVCLPLGGATGCKPGARRDTGDQEVLDKLAAFKPAAKIDGRRYVVELKLEGEHVTDEALEHLGRLKELRSLSLFAANVTDAGLEKLQTIEWLDMLGISATPITDKGLEAIGRMKNLRHLWLSKSNFSSEAVEDLKRAIPGLVVYH